MNEGARTVDLHGMTVYQAQICIDAELRRAKGLYRLRLIHGYRGGTALREMIRSRYAKRAGVLRVELGMNPGETDLVLREY